MKVMSHESLPGARVLRSIECSIECSMAEEDAVAPALQLTQLPDDVLAHVAAFLEPSEVGALRTAARSFYTCPAIDAVAVRALQQMVAQAAVQRTVLLQVQIGQQPFDLLPPLQQRIVQLAMNVLVEVAQCDARLHHELRRPAEPGHAAAWTQRQLLGLPQLLAYKRVLLAQQLLIADVSRPAHMVFPPPQPPHEPLPPPQQQAPQPQPQQPQQQPPQRPPRPFAALAALAALMPVSPFRAPGRYALELAYGASMGAFWRWRGVLPSLHLGGAAPRALELLIQAFLDGEAARWWMALGRAMLARW